MKCLILAGGFGTRMWPLDQRVAKPLLVLGGKPIVTHIVEKVPKQMEIIVSTNKKFVADFLQWQKRHLNRNVKLFIEEALSDEEKLGPVKSIAYLIEKERIEEDLLVIGGDNYFSFSLSDFISTYNGKDPLIAVYDIKDKDKGRHFGAVELRRRRVIAFHEKPLQPSTSLVGTACYILPTKVFKYLSACCAENKNNLGDFIAYLLEREDVYAYLFKGDWFDIGTIDFYEEAKREIERHTPQLEKKQA